MAAFVCDEDDIEQLVAVMRADHLLFGSDSPAQELERQGMGDVPMLHPNTYDQNFVGEAGGVFDGDIVQVAVVLLGWLEP